MLDLYVWRKANSDFFWACPPIEIEAQEQWEEWISPWYDEDRDVERDIIVENVWVMPNKYAQLLWVFSVEVGWNWHDGLPPDLPTAELPEHPTKADHELLAEKFAVLHLLPTAPQAIFKDVYRKLMHLAHTDKNEDGDRSLELNLAREYINKAKGWI